MATFIREDREELAKKLVKIPSKLVQKAKEVNATVGEKYPTAQGSKRMKKIALGADEKEYNKKKGEDIVNKDGSVYMRGSAIKKADHELRHTSNDPNDLNLVANGGFDFKKFYSDTLDRLRNSVKEPDVVKQVEPTKPNSIKPPKVNADLSKQLKPSKEGIHIKENKKTIKLTEDQLKILKR